MPSKTPQFDAALDEIFANLVPHARVCGEQNLTGDKGCGETFPIEVEDIAFLKKLRVPPPTLCPRCRLQRRLAYRIIMRPIFYKKTCSAPGHSEKAISFYAEDNPVKVYDNTYYRSDDWDAIDMGTPHDPSISFFVQFGVFGNTVPRQAIFHDPGNVNSELTISGASSKDCYWIVDPYFAENVQYGWIPIHSRSSIDISDLVGSEECYSCARVERSYGCAYCVDITGCLSSYFLYDCKNCSDCFGCINLRNKKYCWFNEQLTEDEYKRKLAEIDMGSYTVIKEYHERFRKLMLRAIRKNLDNLKIEKSSGNHLRQCKNCFCSYHILGSSENIRYSGYADKITDCIDVFGAADASLVYESSGVLYIASSRFSLMVRNSSAVEYSIECLNVENVFGCIGLRNKKFCIFNKQYTKEEYWLRVDDLKTTMLERGEYGEFFPLSMSPFPYNNSTAWDEFPLTKEEVLVNGWKWKDEEKMNPDLTGLEVVQASDLPDDIKDVGDNILKKAIICAQSGKPFRLTPYELSFYRKHNLPLPRLHPDVRINELLSHRLPFRLFDDTCKKCAKAMKSGYDPALGYTVYCEPCYLSAVA